MSKPKQQITQLEEPPVEIIPFEQINPCGWYSVSFPLVHDQNTIIDLWLEEARKWINENNITRWTFSFAHGLPAKKHGERISPVYYFREEMAAARFGWRFKGETKYHAIVASIN